MTPMNGKWKMKWRNPLVKKDLLSKARIPRVPEQIPLVLSHKEVSKHHISIVKTSNR